MNLIEKIIIDADLCIKLGGSSKYQFLYDILPMISSHIYIHSYVRSEVMAPQSAITQLEKLIEEGKVKIVSEDELSKMDKFIYDASIKKLEIVMLNPKHPNKNRGEICSLAYAKATGIPVFATDEKSLQPIIDSQLNTGIDDITCIRIIDLIIEARRGNLNISRKLCKAMWVIAGNSKVSFDTEIWPIEPI